MTWKIGIILAIYLIITGLGFALSDDFYSQMISHKGTDPVLINLSGMVHFFIGMTILVNHFKWTGLLETLVTILGFMFLMKGTLLIIIPESTQATSDNPAQIPWALSLGFMGMGLVLLVLVILKSKKR